MIDATELISVQLSTDRTHMHLRLRDRTGQTISLSLPVSWMNSMLNATPRQIDSGTVHRLDSWTMDRTGNTQDVVLTLRTAEGLAISFATKRWQVEGMATLATYGSQGPTPFKTIH